MKFQKVKYLLLLSGLLFSTACTTTMVPSGIEATYGNPPEGDYEIIATDTAEVSNFNLFGLFAVTTVPDVDLGVKELVNRHAGDGIINIRTWEEEEVWVVGTVYRVRIQGTVIRNKTTDTTSP